MGKPSSMTGAFQNKISDQSHIVAQSNESFTPPLDLSRNSLHFPSTHQATFTADLTPSPTDASPKFIDADSRQMSVDCSYDGPQILTGPKPEWHYRSTRDLAKGHIPFLSGDGPQRTPIRIKVPEKSNQQMYLGITVLTHDRQYHGSKIVVPAKTKVDSKYLSRDNNLDCLKFDECSKTDHFDLETRHLYLQINDQEHRAQLKEVRIHMFNLYQNQVITKELIESKKLHLCQLAFWFCFFDKTHCIPISPQTFSCTIREKSTNGRSNVLQPITTNKQTNTMNTYSMACTDDFNQDDMNNDDSDDDH